MKKNNIKPLVMSALTALAMGAVGTVGTFALFTDKAETTVSIEAGKVDVSTGVTIQKAYSLNTSDDTSVTSETHATFVNGGTADISGSTVQVAYWTPGDGLKLRTSPDNASNVNILGRFKISLVGNLAPALEIRVRASGASDTTDNNILYGRKGAGMLVSDWESIAYTTPATKPTAYDIDIVFPDHDNGEIKFGEDNKDNQYMNKSATIVITYEAVQGNADVGANLLERINTTLATENIRDKGYNKTMYDAMVDIAEANLADEAAVKAAGYVWSPETDQFYDFSSAPADAYKYFKIADTKAAAGDYSIYASSAWNVSPVSVSGVGFDVGSHTSDIASVSYTGLGETNARTNILRTNSLDTDVIAEAPYDTVLHFGDAHTVVIHDIANHSYHEYGRVALMDVAKGRVALEAGSDVKNLHFSATKATETEKTFDAITVAYDESVTLPTFSRDAVQIAAEGTLVVELQNSVDEQKADSDYVWLFQQGLKEQIRITEEVPTEQVYEKVAEAPKSTDNSVKQKTSVAAEQIANNLSANATYTTYEELQEAGAIKADGSVDETVLESLDAVIENTGIEQNAEAKQAAFVEIVEETISVIAGEESENHVVRIKSVFYDTFKDAFDAAKSGDTIRILRGNGETGNVVPAPHHDDQAYNVTGKNITINVEKGATLSLQDCTNNKFVMGRENVAGRLSFEGEGTVTFEKGNNYYGIATNVGQGIYDNCSLSFRGVTVKSDVAGALLGDGLPVIIESGYFKNIAVDSNANISGGLFSNDVSTGLVEGKMCVNDSGDANYPWIIRDLDAAHANFSVKNGNETSYWVKLDSAFGATENGSVVTALGDINHDGQVTGFLANNCTFDLQGHTYNQNGANPAVPTDNGATTTIKNGYINASSINTNSFTVIGDNLRLNDGIYSGIAEHLVGVYVKDAQNTFTIQTSAPEEYAAKITRGTEEFYFLGEHGVKYAMDKIQSGDVVTVNQNDSEAVGYLSGVGDTLTIILGGDATVFPEIKADNGDVKPTNVNEYTRSYVVNVAAVCKIGSVSFETFEAGWAALDSAGEELVLLKDVSLHSSYDSGLEGQLTKSWSGTGALKLNLNGHTINSFNDDSDVLYYLGSNFGLLKLVKQTTRDNQFIIDNYEDGTNGQTKLTTGGIYAHNCCCVSGANKNQTELVIKAGTFTQEIEQGVSAYAMFNSQPKLTISGGTFKGCYSSSNYLGGTSTLSITGGIFREDFLAEANRGAKQFDWNNKAYYQYKA